MNAKEVDETNVNSDLNRSKRQGPQCDLSGSRSYSSWMEEQDVAKVLTSLAATVTNASSTSASAGASSSTAVEAGAPPAMTGKLHEHESQPRWQSNKRAGKSKSLLTTNRTNSNLSNLSQTSSNLSSDNDGGYEGSKESTGSTDSSSDSRGSSGYRGLRDSGSGTGSSGSNSGSSRSGSSLGSENEVNDVRHEGLSWKQQWRDHRKQGSATIDSGHIDKNVDQHLKKRKSTPKDDKSSQSHSQGGTLEKEQTEENKMQSMQHRSFPSSSSSILKSTAAPDSISKPLKRKSQDEISDQMTIKKRKKKKRRDFETFDKNHKTKNSIVTIKSKSNQSKTSDKSHRSCMSVTSSASSASARSANSARSEISSFDATTTESTFTVVASSVDDNLTSNDKKQTQKNRSLKPAPYFYYVDHSQEPDDDALEPITPPSRVPSFPSKLMALLNRPDLSNIIRWMHHGRSWCVINPSELETQVIPLYFEHAKFPSFLRQAKGWGFKKLHNEKGYKHCYYNEYFLRGMPHLIKKMPRPEACKKKDGGADAHLALHPKPDHEPDLCQISMEHPLPMNIHPNDIHLTMLDAINNIVAKSGPKARLPIVHIPSSSRSIGSSSSGSKMSPSTRVKGPSLSTIVGGDSKESLARKASWDNLNSHDSKENLRFKRQCTTSVASTASAAASAADFSGDGSNEPQRGLHRHSSSHNDGVANGAIPEQKQQQSHDDKKDREKKNEKHQERKKSSSEQLQQEDNQQLLEQRRQQQRQQIQFLDVQKHQLQQLQRFREEQAKAMENTKREQQEKIGREQQRQQIQIEQILGQQLLKEDAENLKRLLLQQQQQQQQLLNPAPQIQLQQQQLLSNIIQRMGMSPGNIYDLMSSQNQSSRNDQVLQQPQSPHDEPPQPFPRQSQANLHSSRQSQSQQLSQQSWQQNVNRPQQLSNKPDHQLIPHPSHQIPLQSYSQHQPQAVDQNANFLAYLISQQRQQYRPAADYSQLHTQTQSLQQLLASLQRISPASSLLQSQQNHSVDTNTNNQLMSQLGNIVSVSPTFAEAMNEFTKPKCFGS